MSWIVKVGKQGKKIVKKLITPAEKHYVGYTRRIERVQTTRRICAMTFDDGPMGLPASPDRFDGRTLTDVLLDTLAQYGARGSFDVIGDTSANYPDEAGKLGSAAWGGVRFDHYPDIHCDEQGGAEHNDRLIRRMLAEGHQITNHGYRHIIFGKKPFVYGAREYLPGFDAAVEDLSRLHTLMQTRYGYTMTLARPPHYVDKMTGGFTSYDVYDHMGYQYMAASFDGAGWLPSTEPNPEAARRRRFAPWSIRCAKRWKRTRTFSAARSFSRRTATTWPSARRWPLRSASSWRCCGSKAIRSCRWASCWRRVLLRMSAATSRCLTA